MRKNEQSLGDVLKLLFRDEKNKPMFFQTKIEQAWRQKMGTTIDRNTQDILLKNRILYIKITSSSLRQELTYSKDQILEFANTTIGEKDYVTQVVIM